MKIKLISAAITLSLAFGVYSMLNNVNLDLPRYKIEKVNTSTQKDGVTTGSTLLEDLIKNEMYKDLNDLKAISNHTDIDNSEAQELVKEIYTNIYENIKY